MTKYVETHLKKSFSSPTQKLNLNLIKFLSVKKNHFRQKSFEADFCSEFKSVPVTKFLRNYIQFLTRSQFARLDIFIGIVFSSCPKLMIRVKLTPKIKNDDSQKRTQNYLVFDSTKSLASPNLCRF